MGNLSVCYHKRLKLGIPSATWQFWKSVHMRHKTWRFCPHHGDTGYQSDFIQYQKIRMWHDVIKKDMRNPFNKMKLPWCWSKKGTVWRDFKTTRLLQNLVEQLSQLTENHWYKVWPGFTVDAIHIVLIPKFLSSIHGAEFWQKKNHGYHRKLKWPNFFPKVLGLSITVRRGYCNNNR